MRNCKYQTRRIATVFAFQGYPIDKYILPKLANSKLYMQAGNSVTTTLIERIANQIIEVL